MENSRYPNKTIVRITPKIEDLIPHKRIQCPEPECTDIFSNIGNLQMHLIRHHKINKDQKLHTMKNPLDDSNILKLYYCPINDCIYNENVQHGGRSFTNMKYIRQHYQKVHIAKTIACSKCDKSFGTIGQQKAHEFNCGKVFQCGTCNCNYSTKEALLTHTKRKKHFTKEDVEAIKLNEQNKNMPKIKLPPFKRVKFYQKPIKNENSLKTKNYITYLQPHSEYTTPSNLITLPPNTFNVYLIKVFDEKDMLKTEANTAKALTTAASKLVTEQTIETTNNDCMESNATECENKMKCKKYEKSNDSALFANNNNNENNQNNSDMKFLNLQEQQCSAVQSYTISSQTECDQTALKQDNFSSTYYEDSCFNELVDIETQTEFPTDLDQLLYANMHTQTCDDFLQELGLTDIETQTNWSTIPDTNINGRLNENATLSGGAHDELLVSTETQTSFTQCLLECNNNNNNSNQNNNNNNSVLLTGITQHTQTCDTLLDGLFNGQDFLNSFQSTHTQT